MSQTLAKEYPEVVTCLEIPGAHHNDIIPRAGSTFIVAMALARAG